MRSLLWLFAVLLPFVTPASAQQVKQIDIMDFLLDWESYEGHTIALMGGAVVFAKADRVMVYSSAGVVMAMPPWRDKEDLRYLMRACAGPHIVEECKVPVVGAVSRTSDGKAPELINVDFALPVFN